MQQNMLRVSPSTLFAPNEADIRRGVENLGFLSTVIEAYNYHRILRTSPDDWWFTILQKIGLSINSYKSTEAVCTTFVDFHEKIQLVFGMLSY